MTILAILAAVGLCAATLATDGAPGPVLLVGETCPAVAPPGARVERARAAVDETAAAPRNVCLVFFEADLDDSKG